MFFKKKRLPEAIIIGAQKAATGSLYSHLLSHPKIKGASKKEVHFFDNDEDFFKGVEFYKSHFPKLSATEICIEASPRYLYHPEVPARMLKLLGKDVKLIVSLREPIERAFSAWNMYKQMADDAQYIDKLKLKEQLYPNLKMFSTLYKDGFSTFKHVINQENEWHENGIDVLEPSMIRRGFYVEQIKRWMNYFEEKNFFFLNYEAIKDPISANNTLKDIVSFLGLDSSKINIDVSIYHNKRNYSSGIDSNTKNKLTDIYMRNNKNLRQITGLNLQWDSLED